MPTLRVSAAEATALKRKRARDKAHNAVVMACVGKVNARLKTADPLETGVLTAVRNDLRKLVR